LIEECESPEIIEEEGVGRIFFSSNMILSPTLEFGVSTTEKTK